MMEAQMSVAERLRMQAKQRGREREKEIVRENIVNKPRMRGQDSVQRRPCGHI